MTLLVPRVNVHHSPDACYLSRHVALKVGARVETPALTVNRLCGSGFETVVQASALSVVTVVPLIGQE